MATQSEIQVLINEIVPNANYKANQLRPLLSSILDFSSAGQTLVYEDIECNGTTDATTTVLQYGVNIIRTSTLDNYACKLPQPVTGKRIIVVNKAVMPISLFPSNVGGQINNNLIDAPAIIPPDGKAYDFICIENPQPGAWVWSAPAINQYDSGEITADTLDNNNVYSSAFPSIVRENAAYFSSPEFGYDGLNKPSLPLALVGSSGSPNNFVAFKPGTGWSAITKVKVYTNLAYDVNNEVNFGLTSGSWYSSYSGGNFVNITPNTISNFGNYNVNPGFGGVDILVSGATLPFGTLMPNVGDAGTCWGELVIANYNPNGSRVGSFFEGADVNGNDSWFTQMINFQIQPRQALTGFRFRFFLEYF